MPTLAPLHLHWHTEPGVLLGLVLVLLLYGCGVGALRQRLAHGIPWPHRHGLRFVLGLGVLYVAIASPLDHLGERFLLSAHMLQHFLFIYPVPVLLLTGIPGWLLQPLWALPGVTPLVRALTRPLVALTAFHMVFAAWHLPILYEGALHQRLLHNLEHLTFLTTAILVWWPILSPGPPGSRLSSGAQVLYLLALSMGQLPVSTYVTFASTVLYPTYAVAPRLVPLTPLEDQQLGGIVMQVTGMGVLFVALPVVFLQWYYAEERVRHPGETTLTPHPPVG
jgi:putative membrane protein